MQNIPHRNFDISAAQKQRDDFAATVLVDESPEAAFAAVVNVRGWWSENIEGPTDLPGEEFTYRYQDVHRCTVRVSEITSPTRVRWRVMDNSFNFIDDTREWIGTEMNFHIVRTASKTEIRFTHLGLVPTNECFDLCSNAWDFYLQTSLRGLIRTGKGLPNRLEHSVN
jgi:hypothetical protein